VDWRIGLKADQKVWAVSLGLRLGGRRVNFFCSPRCSCDCTTFYRSVIPSVPDFNAQSEFRTFGRGIKKLRVNWLFDLPVVWVYMRNWEILGGFGEENCW
jgi:hypothetical protein